MKCGVGDEWLKKRLNVTDVVRNEEVMRRVKEEEEKRSISWEELKVDKEKRPSSWRCRRGWGKIDGRRRVHVNEKREF